MFSKRQIAALVAEFLGTFTLVSVITALAVRTEFPFFGAVGAGLTLAVTVLALGAVSGAHINPAVTIGLWTIRKIDAAQAATYVVVQLLAGVIALRVNERLLDMPLKDIAATAVDWRIIVAEALGTCIFTLGIAAAVYRKYTGGTLAFTVGASLTLGALVASLGGNGIINPAVALGLQSFSTSYIVGPIIGAVIGFVLYAAVFAPLDAVRNKSK